MTTMTPAPGTVTGGVDTHADLHVAAAVDHLGGVLGTAQFATTAAGYRKLLAWLRSFGPLHAVGVEGTCSYGTGLARHLTEQDVTVVEVARANRQVRRRQGKSDTIDAVAAARAVLSGEATATPKTHDGPVEALRALKVVQRSANKARTQALNQLRALVLTAPEELRERLRTLKGDELVRTCAGFRVAADDDSLPGIVRLALRELAQRVQQLQAQLKTVVARLHRITTTTAPDLVAIQGVGPDVASTLLVTAGDNPHRLRSEASFAALCGASPLPATSGKKQNRHRLNRGGDDTPTPPSGASRSSASATTNAPRTTSPSAPPTGRTRVRSCAASSATSPPRFLPRYPANSSTSSLSRRPLDIGASLMPVIEDHAEQAPRHKCRSCR